ncbi:MAG: tRNA (adenosine(37)-N6)-threonylcarbamoyltransferase complex dimerization subunit type 1 TsaB [Aggregatilineales bacterium]
MLLAIDTATRFMSLAIHDEHELIAEYTARIGNHHTTAVAPTLQTLMQSCEVTMQEVTAVAVSVGPGSYTGVRIGVAMAKGIASAHNLPLIGMSTLDILAYGQPNTPAGNALIAVVQAGRGRIIVQSYRWRKGSWGSRNEPKLMNWETLIETIDGSATISGEISEEGLETIKFAQANAIPVTIAPAGNRLRRAGFLAEAALDRLNSTEDKSEFEAARLLPVYVKSED